MNTLSWFLYLAEVFGSLQTVLRVIGIPMFLASLILILSGYLSRWNFITDQDVQIKNTIRKIGPAAFFGGFFLILVSLFVPSKETMYMISASEIGEVIVTSNDAKEIYSELKDTILMNLKNLQKENQNAR